MTRRNLRLPEVAARPCVPSSSDNPIGGVARNKDMTAGRTGETGKPTRKRKQVQAVSFFSTIMVHFLLFFHWNHFVGFVLTFCFLKMMTAWQEPCLTSKVS